MCGVFGYVGKRDPLQVCLSGLEHLEYRGYDSTGIAGLSHGSIVICKKAGKLSELKATLKLPRLELAIAHTRWATHGKVNDENAHPHLDPEKMLALVHNGIIENYAALREELQREGRVFASETDTEVVAHLIAKYYDGNVVKALRQTMEKLKGMFALIILHKNHPDELYAATRGCPLSIATHESKTESILSSDIHAIQGKDFHIVFLEADEIASVSSQKVEIFDRSLCAVAKKIEKSDEHFKAPSKEGYEHYMLKEIHEQRKSTEEALKGRMENGEVRFRELEKIESRLSDCQQIAFLGAGTSAHAGKIAALFTEEVLNVSAQCEISSEARYRTPLLTPETLIVVLSQSGETADTLAALREAKHRGCTVIAICNVKNSTIMREADRGILQHAGVEISVCSTKAFTSQLAVLFLFILYWGRLTSKISVEEMTPFLEALVHIPQDMESILKQSETLKNLAQKYAKYEDYFFMGRRYMFPIACEAALKLKEISYVNANGYPAGELKHGPIALLSTAFPVIAFCANHQTEEKITSNLMEVKARGAPTLAIAMENQRGISGIADDIFFVPTTMDTMAPFTTILAGQLLAYYIAKERKCDIDQPRNLAKSVTVE